MLLFWRDFLPPALLDALMDKEAGERIQMPLKNGNVVAEFRDKDLFEIKSNQFDRRFLKGMNTEPRLGRFYPKGILKGIAGVFKTNLQSFRWGGSTTAT